MSTSLLSIYTFRAAYFPATSATGEICLTLFRDRHLSDRQLLHLAMVEAISRGIDVTEDDIVIGQLDVPMEKPWTLNTEH